MISMVPPVRTSLLFSSSVSMLVTISYEIISREVREMPPTQVLLFRTTSSKLFSSMLIGVPTGSYGLLHVVLSHRWWYYRCFDSQATIFSCQAIDDQILTCFARFSLLPGNCIGTFLDNILSALFLSRMSTYMSFSNIIGQAYDGAPDMSGILNGCQAIIKQLWV